MVKPSIRFKGWYLCGLLCFNIACAEDKAGNASPTDAEVLKSWQGVSGQSGVMADTPNGSVIEWHGEVTSDVYTVDIDSASNSPALSGIKQGNFQLTRIQGDLRSVEETGDVNYIQGGWTVTNDRAAQTLYTSQINTLQAGRAGPGYQIAIGDVVASFSQLGSNLGVRGIYGAKQFEAVTMYGYTGQVADTWESLLRRSTINGQPSRTRFLREASGGMADIKLSEQWNVFGTLQAYTDQQSSLNPALSLGQVSQQGSTGTLGAKYQTAEALVSAEMGTSRFDNNQAGFTPKGDNAVIVDASYRFRTLGLRAGYHDLGVRYTSLAQTVAPGISDAYLGGDWSILPSLTYSLDLRNSKTELPSFFGVGNIKNSIDSVINRVNYYVTQLPGLNLSLQDIRNWGRAETSSNQNSNTAFSAFYAAQQYNGSVTLGHGQFKNSANPLSNSDSDSLQLTIGRQVFEGELLNLPDVSMSVQLTGGYQRQRIANDTQTSTTSTGFNLSLQSKKLGQGNLSFVNQDTRQPDGGNTLNSKFINLDWNKVFSDALAFRAYIRNAMRNHGVQTLYIDEQIVGAQLDYRW